MERAGVMIGVLCLLLAGCGNGNGGGHDGGDVLDGGDGADGADEITDPCAGVSCSGHGECVDDGGAARCECHSGYHAEGLECVADPVDCSAPEVLCVDDDAGPNQEYASLQAAADAVGAGETILVFDGSYAGFGISASGTPEDRIVVRAAGTGAVIDSDGPNGYGVYLRNVSYVTIEGLRISGVSDKGVAAREATPQDPVRGLVIRNNTVEDTGMEGMYLSEVADSLVEGNSISGAGVSGADRTHGIYLANAGSDGTTLRGNHIWGCGTAGIHFNGDLSVGGDGIISGLLVEENVIHDNGQNGLNMDGVQDSVVRNNLIYNNDSNGLRAYAIDAAEGPRDLVIVNNTFHVPAGAGWCVRITEDLGGNLVFNNILMNDGGNGSIALDGTSGFNSANNAVVDVFTPDRDDTILSLSQWQGLGYDAGSFLSTPGELFRDAGGGDYQLKNGAPAVDRGLSEFEGHPAPADDITGGGRTGAPDVGAYEGL